jgi:thiamine biosynthesis lipoprotein ApbE
MGTRYTVKIAMTPGDEAEDERIREIIGRELDLASDLLSTWNPDSQISRFNRHRSTEPFPVAPETLGVLERAVRAGVLVPGWTADRILAALATIGHSDALVDLGGEVAVRGRRADGERWRVAVESPGSAFPPVLELENVAIATSGDYRKVYMDAQGRRRCHLIDPRTGEPVTHGLASVTVVHREASWADALATGLLVQGPGEGPALARREHLPARFVVRRVDGTYVVTTTPEFDGLMRGAVRR